MAQDPTASAHAAERAHPAEGAPEPAQPPASSDTTDAAPEGADPSSVAPLAAAAPSIDGGQTIDLPLPGSPEARRIKELFEASGVDLSIGWETERPLPAPPALRVQREFPSESFTLRPKGGGGFAMVEAALARKLRDLADEPERIAVIVSIDDGGVSNHFTQTLVDREDGAWVEAVSNECIVSEAHQLGDDQHRLLAAMGFDPPTDETPNHFTVFDQPVNWAHVAGLLVRALEAVYGVSASAVIAVEVFSVDRASGQDED